jgi:dihydroflavonol-4-reductase
LEQGACFTQAGGVQKDPAPRYSRVVIVHATAPADGARTVLSRPGLCLVTGATGFVGSAVARALLGEGFSLRLLVRAAANRTNIEGLGGEVVTGDLTDAVSLEKAVDGCRYVFHVAADYRIWVPDPAAMMRANVGGTESLMRAAMRAGVERVVYCSSVAALGLTKDGSPADESTEVAPEAIVGPYKQSKYLAEQAVLAMVHEGLPAVIVNPSTPIGPRDIKPTPTGRMIADAASGRMPAYLDTGLNIVHVDDVATGHLLALRHGRIGERYILGGEDFLLKALLGVVAEVAGRKNRAVRLVEPILWPVALLSEAVARAGGAEPLVTRDHLRMARKKMFFSSQKARAELGYAPRPARAAVRDAIAWFRAHAMVPDAA